MQLVSQPGQFDSVGDLADELGLLPDKVESYGRLVCVTAMTPTKFGEGKTTTAISLADGLGRLGLGLGRLPVCVAKTHLSLSHDPTLLGAPRGFTLPVRELHAYTGAGWLVAVCGTMQTMPGLPAEPAAFPIDVEADGRISGFR